MQGRVKLGRMSRNLDKIMRRVWIRRRVAEDPFYDVANAPSCAELFPRGFGGLDALFIGDFGQIEPVKDRSLMDSRRERISGNLNHALSNEGMERGPRRTPPSPRFDTVLQRGFFGFLIRGAGSFFGCRAQVGACGDGAVPRFHAGRC